MTALLLLAFVALPPAGLWYPAEGRRDGVPLDPAAIIAEVKALGAGLLGVSFTEGSGLDDAVALLEAAAAAGLPVLARPLAISPAGLARLSRRLTGATLAGWVGAGPADSPLPVYLERAGPEPVPGPVYAAPPALAGQAPGFGWWGEVVGRIREAAGGPLLAEIPCAPPAWFVAAGALATAAPHPDLYRSAAERPHTTARLAGEYLLLPEPAQLRLAVYAALGHGARGVMFAHLGHLTAGQGPFHGADRAATVRQLGREIGWFERFWLEGVPQPAPATPTGVAAGVLRAGDEWLVLLWRVRRLDGRSAAGDPTAGFSLELPGEFPEGLRCWRVEADQLTAQPADYRAGGLRLNIEPLDLTRLYLLSARPQEALATRLAGELPAAALDAVKVAAWRWEKVDYTLGQIEATGRAATGRVALAEAGERSHEALGALEYGYLRSAWRLAHDAERLTRLAQSWELEAAMAARPPAGAGDLARATFAALPRFWRPVAPLDRGPLTLADKPLRLAFEGDREQGVDPAWTALPGSDQTVATLAVAPGGHDSPRALGWTPVGDDPGALYLPFTPRPRLTLTLHLTGGPPAGVRLLGLAAGGGQPLLAGVALHPDGTVAGWPAGSTARLTPDRWQTLTVALTAGRATVTWDGVSLAELPVEGPAGALVLAKRAGADPITLRLDDVTVSGDG